MTFVLSCMIPYLSSKNITTLKLLIVGQWLLEKVGGHLFQYGVNPKKPEAFSTLDKQAYSPN